MAKRYHFLRFVSVLLKVLAVLVLLAGIVGVILGFVTRGAGDDLMGQYLYWAARVGGLLALIMALFYFIMLWAVADLIRVQLAIEEHTRQAASGLSALPAPVSAEAVGRQVSAALEPHLSAVRELLEREPVVEQVVQRVERTAETVPVAEAVEREKAMPPRRAHVSAAAVAQDTAGEAAAVGVSVRPTVPDVPVVDLPQAKEAAAAEEVEEAAVEEESVVEPEPEEMAPAPQEAAEELAEVTEAEEAEVEATAAPVHVGEEAVAEELGEDVDEARTRAKAALDRSLEEAARQMADLEETSADEVSEAKAEEGDNLAEIAGIGPVFRVRLRQAGIDNFAALAASTPEELARITEQPQERIERDDWIGQAERKLAVG